MQINWERGINPMSNSTDVKMIQLAPKRVKLDNSENEDRLSDLPESIILHTLSLLNTEEAVRTCILSKRWKDLWKRLPALIMHSYGYTNLRVFNKFVSKVLSLRDSSIALQSLDFAHDGYVDIRLLKRIVNYVSSHNVQRLGIEILCDIEKIRHHSIFSCQTLTFLKLSIYPRGHVEKKTLFPKSISLPSLTTLHLEHFAFCASYNNAPAEPFSVFNRLNTLALLQCGVRDTLTLCISSATLVNFRMHSDSDDYYEIEFCTLSLRTFAFIGNPYQKLYGSSLAYVKYVDIDAETLLMEVPQFLLNWLSELTYTESLTVTASTLQVLNFNANLLKMKLPSLGNLKFLKVKKKPFHYLFHKLLIELRLRKIKSRKEASMLRKSFEAGLEPSAPIPNGIVEFLIQNSPSAQVSIVDC